MASSSSDELHSPKRLRSLALNVMSSGDNNLLHRFVLDNSAPNESGGERYIGAVLRSMSGIQEVNALNGDGYSALHLAVLKKDLLMVKKLLSCLRNIDVNTRCGENRGKDTALHLAARQGHLPIILELLGAKADLNIMNGWGDTAFIIALEAFKDLDIIKLFVNERTDVNLKGGYGGPLHAAARGGSLAAVEFLLKSGADVNQKDAYGAPPLFHAAEYGNVDCVERLVTCGADWGATNNEGETALHYAAFGGHCSTVEFLLGIGADVDAKNNDGSTPLIQAASKNKSQVAELLLLKGANVNARDNRGYTPLYYAVWEDYLETCSILVNHGADFTAVDDHGWTPLHVAVHYDRERCVRLLLEKGADRNAKNNEGRTPFDEAM